jgi:hypothetical protein
LHQFPPAQTLPYLADVAQLEMARVQAYHAADADGVSPERLQAAMHTDADLPAWRFALHPSLHLIDSPMAALSLWQAHQQDGAQRDDLLAAIDVHHPECAAVFRSGDAVLCLPVSAADVALLRGLQAGLAFGASIAQAPEGADGQALDIPQTLALLIQHQLITDVTHPPTDHTPLGD